MPEVRTIALLLLAATGLLVGAPFRRSCRNRLQLPRSRTAALVSRAARVTVRLAPLFLSNTANLSLARRDRLVLGGNRESF